MVVKYIYIGRRGRPQIHNDPSFLQWAYEFCGTSGISNFLSISRSTVRTSLLDYGIAEPGLYPFATIPSADGPDLEDQDGHDYSPLVPLEADNQDIQEPAASSDTPTPSLRISGWLDDELDEGIIRIHVHFPKAGIAMLHGMLRTLGQHYAGFLNALGLGSGDEHMKFQVQMPSGIMMGAWLWAQSTTKPLNITIDEHKNSNSLHLKHASIIFDWISKLPSQFASHTLIILEGNPISVPSYKTGSPETFDGFTFATEPGTIIEHLERTLRNPYWQQRDRLTIQNCLAITKHICRHAGIIGSRQATATLVAIRAEEHAKWIPTKAETELIHNHLEELEVERILGQEDYEDEQEVELILIDYY
ncbi:hypothetical protein FRC01_003626 [Tulasnella sp. 417]|nr:hypothetical protein FRC01_003626 [Tulasnella sp. 417]